MPSGLVDKPCHIKTDKAGFGAVIPTVNIVIRIAFKHEYVCANRVSFELDDTRTRKGKPWCIPPCPPLPGAIGAFANQKPIVHGKCLSPALNGKSLMPPTKPDRNPDAQISFFQINRSWCARCLGDLLGIPIPQSGCAYGRGIANNVKPPASLPLPLESGLGIKLAISGVGMACVTACWPNSIRPTTKICVGKMKSRSANIQSTLDSHPTKGHKRLLRPGWQIHPKYAQQQGRTPQPERAINSTPCKAMHTPSPAAMRRSGRLILCATEQSNLFFIFFWQTIHTQKRSFPKSAIEPTHSMAGRIITL